MPMTGTRWFDCKGDVQLNKEISRENHGIRTNRERFAQGTVDHVANRVDDGARRGDRRVSYGLDRLDGDVGRLAVIGADAVPLVDGGVQEAPQVLQQTTVGLQRLRSEQILQKKERRAVKVSLAGMGNKRTCLRLSTAINQREMMRQMEKASGMAAGIFNPITPSLYICYSDVSGELC